MKNIKIFVTVQPSRIDKWTKTAENIPRTALDSEWEFPNMLPKAFQNVRSQLESASMPTSRLNLHPCKFTSVYCSTI